MSYVARTNGEYRTSTYMISYNQILNRLSFTSTSRDNSCSNLANILIREFLLSSAPNSQYIYSARDMLYCTFSVRCCEKRDSFDSHFISLCTSKQSFQYGMC